MCVAAIAWKTHPDWLLVAIGNRDEFHDRPADPLARWEDGSGIIAGRDLQGGGTWLGIAEPGRFALVTNYRVPEGPQPGRASRGILVTDLLAGKPPARTHEMNPFNLVHASGQDAWYLGNHPAARHEPLTPGIHGLSNGGFDDLWPKTGQLQRDLQDWLQSDSPGITPLFEALRKETPDVSSYLAESEPEAAYAPVFIRNPVYGTRCSTVVTVNRNGAGTIAEVRFDRNGDCSGKTTLEFCWQFSTQ